MNISDFRALVEQRRSICGYDESREVSEEFIKTILDCARGARLVGNGQSIRKSPAGFFPSRACV